MVGSLRAGLPDYIGKPRVGDGGTRQSYSRDAAAFFLLGGALALVLQATTNRILESSTAYSPTKCASMSSDGHCNDDYSGGAWSYRHPDGTCASEEATLIAQSNAARKLPEIFPEARDILDFGGGLGAYLTGYRDAQKAGKRGNLVTVEPHPLGECIFPGLSQSQVDWPNTPLGKLPEREFDVVQTIEVLEHIPVSFHPHLIDALTQATRKYLLFSAAHPGQDGEGHVGPSMKTRDEWIREIEARGELVVDEYKTAKFHGAAGGVGILVENGTVFRRREEGRKGTKDQHAKAKARNVKRRSLR